MNNNRGFTLIELLVVIVILAGVSLIAVSGINASLERRDVKNYNEQKQLAINAAKIYFSLNDEVTSVKIGQLKCKKYFNEISKVDKLCADDQVKLVASDYEYQEVTECLKYIDDIRCDENGNYIIEWYLFCNHGFLLVCFLFFA